MYLFIHSMFIKKERHMKRKSIFMVHKHHATRLHYDVRIEMDGKLKSWALQEIPIQPSKPVLAIQVPDHPFWYRHFEGVIPEGQYGAGPVMVWDKGLYTVFMKDHANKKLSVAECLEKGFMLVWLEGQKLNGGYALVRTSKKQRWLLIKLEDEYARHGGRLPTQWQRSVKSGKTLNQILNTPTKKNAA